MASVEGVGHMSLQIYVILLSLLQVNVSEICEICHLFARG